MGRVWRLRVSVNQTIGNHRLTRKLANGCTVYQPSILQSTLSLSLVRKHEQILVDESKRALKNGVGRADCSQRKRVPKCFFSRLFVDFLF